MDVLNDSRLTKAVELHNPDNDNANCKLWIQPDGRLFKEYVLFDKRTEKNIKNIRTFTHGHKHAAISAISEIALPLELVINSGKKIIGYTMEYFPDSCTLSDFLDDSHRNDSAKKNVLLQLAGVIQRLPRDIYIGDLHGRNVLVDQENHIHIIDVDGFSQKHNQISCPVQHASWKSRKYWHGNKLVISKDTDIFCFIGFLLEWLSGVDMVNQYTLEAIFEYLDYLERVSPIVGLAEMLRRPFGHGKNYISTDIIGSIDPTDLGRCKYQSLIAQQSHKLL